MSSKGDSVDVDEKQVARSSRLTLRKNNEEVLRKELKAEARAKCAHTFKAFAECAKASSIFVVFQCRQENQAMSDCMEKYYNEDEFRRYVDSKGYKINDSR